VCAGAHVKGDRTGFAEKQFKMTVFPGKCENSIKLSKTLNFELFRLKGVYTHTHAFPAAQPTASKH